MNGLTRNWYVMKQEWHESYTTEPEVQYINEQAKVLYLEDIARDAKAEEVILHYVKSHLHGINNDDVGSIRRKINSVIYGLLDAQSDLEDE